MDDASYVTRDGGLASRPRKRGTTLQGALLDGAARPYRKAGRFAYHFARGKLAADPIFQALLQRGLLADRKRILDLGCGQGLLAAWLQAALECYERGRWPRTWAPPPRPQSVRGIDLMPSEVTRAQRALGPLFEVLQGDIRTTAFGTADAVVLLDVLHYMTLECQEETLRRVRAALPAGGLLLLRVGDAGAGLRFRITQWADKLTLLGRGYGRVTTHCRTLAQWRQSLASHGFESRALWMSQGTPFANVLLIAQAN